MIVVDKREGKELIQKLRAKKDIKVEEDFLEVGDFQLSDGFIIERKTIQDLVASISDRRLFTQLGNMLQAENPILAIINDNKWMAFYFCRNRYIHNVYLGTMTTITLSYPKVRIMQFDTEEEFISFVASLEKKLNETGKSGERPKALTRRPTSLQDRKENALACSQGIGIKSAKLCLENYKTISKLCGASLEDLEKILGKKASNLYELLNK